MSDYTYQVLRVVVAQICQTIGWHSIQSTPLELLVDILHKYLQELSRETYRHTELYGRTEPNLVDVGLAFRNLNINLSDIEEYISYVDCVGCSVDVPKYPVKKESNLNFLKPGSKEVLTRPVHIPEYLPPIYPEKEGHGDVVKKEPGTDLSSSNVDAVNLPQNENIIFKKPEISENVAKKPKIFIEDEGRPTREISSVMMTSSGFISPAREGKLPDAKAPIVPEYKSPPPPPPLAAITTSTLPVGSIDSKFDKKEKKKKSIPSEKEGRKREKVVKDSHKKLAHSVGDTAGQGAQQPEKLRPIKKQKNKQKHRGGDHQMDLSCHSNAAAPLETLDVDILTARSDAATSLHQSHQGANLPPSSMPMNLGVKQKIDEIKLSSEPSKEKLNIFKKISTAKKERDDMSRSPNIFHDSYILSSIPEGTTITPALPLKNLHHQPPQQSQPLSTASVSLQQQQIDDDPVICVDDEPSGGFVPDIAKNIPVPLPPGTTIKAQTPKKPRKSKQQQQAQMQSSQQLMDPNLPLNLSSEITATPLPLNMIKKQSDIIQNSRLSYPTFSPQKPQKEKKERRKPKAKEPKQKDPVAPSTSSSSMNMLPQVNASGPAVSSFDDKNLKNFRENAASLFFKNCPPMNTKMGSGKTGDSILSPPAPNPYGGPPNFPNVSAPIPMFPFYAFPPRPGLIPNPGLFPTLQTMPDNPAFNKFLPIMRFSNFGNINKGPRLTSAYDDDPLPLPPIDTEKSYCNVAPLVPDSMKFQLSPTRLKPKNVPGAPTPMVASSSSGLGSDNGSGGSAETPQGPPSKIAKTQIATTTTIFDSPIEISDDENVKSGNEDKDVEGGEQTQNNGSDITMKDVTNTAGEGGNDNDNAAEEDVIDERKEKSEKRKDKLHKKGKKEKEGKIKKKKDKKDKSKSKDKAEKRKEKEEKKDKDRIKKLKKEKKKDKLRSRTYSGEESKLDSTNPDNSQHSTVPKLTLKIGLGNSPQPDSPDGRKLSIKSHSDDMTDSFDDGKIIPFDRRESSPELARISPLVTRPPKQKSSSTDNLGMVAPSSVGLVECRLSQSNVAGSPPTATAASAVVASSSMHATVQGSSHLTGAPQLLPPTGEDKKSDSEDCTGTIGNATSHTTGGGVAALSGGGAILSSAGPVSHQTATRGPGRPPKNSSATHHHHHHHHGPSLSAGSSSIGGSVAGAVGAISSFGAMAASASIAGSAGLMTSHVSSSSLASASAGGTSVYSSSSTSVSSTQNNSSTGTGGNANQTVQTTDAEGNQVWICPACGRVDDGTPMIGCDGCDAWYHWVCVGIQVPPDDNEDWYCRVCIAKKQEAHGADKKRKRKKKNKTN